MHFQAISRPPALARRTAAATTVQHTVPGVASLSRHRRGPAMTDSAAHESYLERLQERLWELGLEAGIHAPVLVAKNSAVAGTNAQGTLMCPGLIQQVELCELSDRGLWWCWIWSPLRPAVRGAPTPPPEREPLCPADDIEDAAHRIAAVLALHEGTAEEPRHA